MICRLTSDDVCAAYQSALDAMLDATGSNEGLRLSLVRTATVTVACLCSHEFPPPVRVSIFAVQCAGRQLCPSRLAALRGGKHAALPLLPEAECLVS